MSERNGVREVDQRRLYAREAAPSMFAYGTELLHLLCGGRSTSGTEVGVPT